MTDAELDARLQELQSKYRERLTRKVELAELSVTRLIVLLRKRQEPFRKISVTLSGMVTFEMKVFWWQTGLHI
jgi:hypothetical protein